MVSPDGHQSLADLESEGAPGLAAVVQQNTQFKQYFSASEPELQGMSSII